MSNKEQAVKSLDQIAAGPPPRSAPKIINGKGTIKAVNSSTSVTVIGVSHGGPPPEMIIYFEGLDGPRMKPNGKSDPWALTVRDNLRRFAIGKTCYFHTTNDLPSSSDQQKSDDPNVSRRFGQVVLEEGKINLTNYVLANGLATVRPSRIERSRLPEDVRKHLEDQEALEKSAREQKLGMHAGGTPPMLEGDRKIDPLILWQKAKGQRYPAVVDIVMSASFIRAMIEFDGKYHSFPFQLTNVQAPEIRRNPETGKRESQEYAEEARFFVEREILHRDVFIIPDSAEGNRLSARVVAPKGDLGQVLLKLGFARLVGLAQLNQAALNKQSVYQALPHSVETLYRTEQENARRQKLRIWKDWQAPPEQVQTPVPTILESFDGIVVEVVNADTISVAPLNKKAPNFAKIMKELDLTLVDKAKVSAQLAASSADKGEDERKKKDRIGNMRDARQLSLLASILLPERRVFLSSIVAPHPLTRRLQITSSSLTNPHPPYAWEGRDYLRQKTVGKIVCCDVEYKRQAPPAAVSGSRNDAERDFCAVMCGDEVLNINLVKEGFARAIRHRREEARSAFYPQILEAEENAIKHRRRLFEFDNQSAPVIDETPEPSGKKSIPWASMTEDERKAAENERRARIAEENKRRKEEREATEKKVADKAPKIRIADICYDAKETRQYVPALVGDAAISGGSGPAKKSTTNVHKGLVDGVSSATRFRLVIPKHSVMLSFVVEGIRSFPTEAQVKRVTPNKPIHPFTQQSIDQTRLLLLDREVDVEIRKLETSGRSWIGKMEMNGKSVAERLVDAGLAYFDTFARIEPKEEEKLKKAQERAKQQKRGMWEFARETEELIKDEHERMSKLRQSGKDEEEEEKVEVKPKERVEKPDRKGSSRPCVVLDVIDSGAVVLQMSRPPSNSLTLLCEGYAAKDEDDADRKKNMPFRMNTLHPTQDSIIAVKVPKSQIPTFPATLKLPTPFADEESTPQQSTEFEWCRAIVGPVDEEKEQLELNLIDYAVFHDLPLSHLHTHLCSMPANLRSPQPCSFSAFLAFVKPVPQTDTIGDEASNTLFRLSVSKLFQCTFEWKDSKQRPFVTLVTQSEAKIPLDEEGEPLIPVSQHIYNLNLDMLRRGLLMVDEENTPRDRKRDMKPYDEAEDKAIYAHVGAWARGDFRTDEEIDVKERRQKKPRRK
ncbi:putative 4SNc-Tudor domain protein short form [Blattamonas nauphoetae]|uniref:4SNc-Tudor domain protein short form n=1 Tax=Blattamonas nauphoetae TaxID=2049346 RepID=A0ABQ9YGI6_9EUKA|nr:putative 4SNc-Tudor domain protein short form [Blattamonas nauphoetae]